jgi:hypothetical protein
MAFELQADCYAGTWAKSAYQENRVEDGDVQEALDAALAVGDFDTANAGHHGTPEEREHAWNSGFESGDPSSCSEYLDPAAAGDGGTAQQQPDPGAGSPQEQTPAVPKEETPADPQEQTPGYPQDDPGSSPYEVASSRRATTAGVA